jgi:hypothetical protein
MNSINAEIRDLEAHIAAEGDAELNNLKAALEKEQASVGSKKEESKVWLNLLEVVSVSCLCCSSFVSWSF